MHSRWGKRFVKYGWNTYEERSVTISRDFKLIPVVKRDMIIIHTIILHINVQSLFSESNRTVHIALSKPGFSLWHATLLNEPPITTGIPSRAEMEQASMGVEYDCDLTMEFATHHVQLMERSTIKGIMSILRSALVPNGKD